MAGPICRDFLNIIRDNIALALDVEQVTRYCRHARPGDHYMVSARN